MRATLAKPIDLDELLNKGFLRIRCPSRRDLEAIASRLGEVEKRDILCARESRGSADNSLSGRHGLDALPAHTDGATQTVPPRWLLMRSLAASATATFLFDAEPVVSDPRYADALGRPWTVIPGGGRAPFYAPILQPAPGGWWVRFNEACMRPGPTAAGPTIRALLEGSRIEHRWQTAEALIISNWRFLHSRARVRSGERRRLERITVR